MENRLSFKLADYLFKNAFPAYKVLYKLFKVKQDAEEINYLKKEIKSGDIVLDIGSNIGFYAAIISDLVGPQGMVHCFEPDRTNFKHLSNVLSSRKNVVLNNVAVADKPGKINIYTSHRLNVDHRTYKPEQYDDSYTIDSISIDEYLGVNNEVNFIKMDIQGFELSALKGMVNTLKRSKDLRILTEFWPYGLKSAGTSAAELIALINSIGYRSWILSGNGLSELNHDNLDQVKVSENDYTNIILKK
jgi:FkbM family methyltransferase